MSEETPFEERLAAIEKELAGIHASVRELAGNLAIVQNSLQRLSGTVSSAAASLGAPRVRELYLRLLLLYDIVEPPPIDLPADVLRFYRTVADQIEQLLAVNGLQRIEADGAAFDPALHKPTAFLDDPDPSNVGRVVTTLRQGFRGEQGVLRPAEVRITRLARDSQEGGAGESGQEPAE